MDLVGMINRTNDLLEMKPDNLMVAVLKRKAEELLETHNNIFQNIITVILQYEKGKDQEGLAYYSERDLFIPVHVKDLDFEELIKYYNLNGAGSHAKFIEELVSKYKKVMVEIEVLEAQI